ncbi:MAG: hypothetical protein R3F07_03930 [Opitutaceae bacterium]
MSTISAPVIRVRLRGVTRPVERPIGVVGVSVLKENDLHVVSAKHLGCGAKTCSGADFAGLFEEDRQAAIEYLENDIRMTYDCAVRMGVVFKQDLVAAY